MTERLLLRCNLCPGDICTLTAAVYSLHVTYPGEYQTMADTSAGELWANNPHIQPFPRTETHTAIDCHYPSVHRCNQESIPFLAGYTEHLAEQLGRPLRLRTNKPCLYLSADEKAWTNQIAQHFTHGKHVPYWLVCAGVKQDYTAKSWPLEHYQQVIDLTLGRIQWVQIGAAEHHHPPLRNVLDLRGKTDHRQFLRLVYHSCGALGPVTYLQHVCAAFDKPYLCLLGGREPSTWVQYPLQHTFAVRNLPCCTFKACWKSRTVPLNDRDPKDSALCDWPVLGLQRPSPKCMALITPVEVLPVLQRHL